MVEALSKVWFCTRHGFPPSFQEWNPPEVLYQWAARVDRGAFAHRWVHEAQIPALHTLRKAEGALRETLDDLLAYSEGMRTTDIRRRAGVTADLFQRLWQSADLPQDARAVVDDLRRVYAEDWGNFEHYHDYFETVAQRLEIVLRRVRSGNLPFTQVLSSGASPNTQQGAAAAILSQPRQSTAPKSHDSESKKSRRNRPECPAGWMWLADAVERYNVARTTLQDIKNKMQGRVDVRKVEEVGMILVRIAALEARLRASGLLDKKS